MNLTRFFINGFADSDSRPPGIEQNRMCEIVSRDLSGYNHGFLVLCAKYAKSTGFKICASCKSRHLLFSHNRQFTAKFAGSTPFLREKPGRQHDWRPGKYFLQVLGASPASRVSPVLLQHPVIAAEGLVVPGVRRSACRGAQSVRVAG